MRPATVGFSLLQLILILLDSSLNPSPVSCGGLYFEPDTQIDSPKYELRKTKAILGPLGKKDFPDSFQIRWVSLFFQIRDIAGENKND